MQEKRNFRCNSLCCYPKEELHMRTIKLFDKGELILEGKIKDGKVKAIMDMIWNTRYTAVLGKHEDDDEM